MFLYDLVISGTGAMYDYSYDLEDYSTDAPWFAQTDHVYDIRIEDGITYIGDNAFAFMYSYNTMIPDSVTEIGENVFLNANIVNLTVPFIGRSENDKTGFESTFAYLFGDMGKIAEEAGIPNSSLESMCKKAYHTYDGYTADV